MTELQLTQFVWSAASVPFGSIMSSLGSQRGAAAVEKSPTLICRAWTNSASSILLATPVRFCGWCAYLIMSRSSRMTLWPVGAGPLDRSVLEVQTPSVTSTCWRSDNRQHYNHYLLTHLVRPSSKLYAFLLPVWYDSGVSEWRKFVCLPSTFVQSCLRDMTVVLVSHLVLTILSGGTLSW